MKGRQLFLAVLTILAGTAYVPASADPESAWIATYNWSPQYCMDVLGSREPQCMQPHGFVFRNLIRTRGGAALENCDDEESISRDIIERLMSIMLNKDQIKAAWNRYGKCSGHSASEYAGLIEYIDRRIEWPSAYDPQNAGIEVKIIAMARQFSAANRGLDYQSIIFRCKGPWLEQIQLCLNADFNYDRASCPSANTCRDDVRLRSFQARPE